MFAQPKSALYQLPPDSIASAPRLWLPPLSPFPFFIAFPASPSFIFSQPPFFATVIHPPSNFRTKRDAIRRVYPDQSVQYPFPCMLKNPSTNTRSQVVPVPRHIVSKKLSNDSAVGKSKSIQETRDASITVSVLSIHPLTCHSHSCRHLLTRLKRVHHCTPPCTSSKVVCKAKARTGLRQIIYSPRGSPIGTADRARDFLSLAFARSSVHTVP